MERLKHHRITREQADTLLAAMWEEFQADPDSQRRLVHLHQAATIHADLPFQGTLKSDDPWKGVKVKNRKTL